MANRGPEHSWGRLVALAISILHHVMSELYIVDRYGDAFPSYLRLWPRQNGLTNPVYYTLATIISLCFVMLVLLLGSANIAGRGIERIVAKKISLVLRAEEEFSSDIAEKTQEAHPHPHHHVHHHSCWRTVEDAAVRGENAEEEHHRRHCHVCWRTVEDAVLKAWIIVRAYSLQHVIARSALTSSAAVIVTIQIVTTIGGGLAKGASFKMLAEDRVFRLIATVLQLVFILIGWSIIIWRWASSVTYYRSQQTDSWRTSLRVEDYWTRHLRELQQAKKTRLRQAQSLKNRIERLVAKEQIMLSVPNTLLSAMIVLQWLLVSFSKACWFASLKLFHNKLMVKLLSFLLPNHEMYAFEDYPKYRIVLEDVHMLGENPKSLRVANRNSIEKARSLIVQGDQDGEYNCEHLIDFIVNNRTGSGLGLSCLEPYKPQTGLKFLCNKRPTEVSQASEEMPDVENQQPQGGNTSLDVSTKSWKMTAVSLLSIILHLSPVLYAEVNKTESSGSDDSPPKAIKDCVETYSRAWEIIDFVDEADIEDEGITSEAADSVEEADVKDDRFISEAADRYFQALQKKMDKGGFSASKFMSATPGSVPEALEDLKKESKSKTEPPRNVSIISRLVRSLAGEKEKLDDRSNKWKGDDSIDWQAAASGSAVYKLCNSIECNEGTDVNDLLKELESCLADIINDCLVRVQRLLLLNSRKWALRRDEKRMAKALYTAGKAKAIMEKL
ncbi:hypothetical protein SUGI_0849990 [Cryptomeria japonica]|nr:hypothetical protein SUGI_0849990 [Cryptomeria japonica]